MVGLLKERVLEARANAAARPFTPTLPPPLGDSPVSNFDTQSSNR